ncbi:hypothetical protein TNCV_1372911 [Trichonephila clavipes]|uniref:Uncharacterized protein n=1 Tax=Trichonephila clavipes TaxID=2585209 RepID=A0A8X6WGY4_TRICX|nr:hypothetical protein TNCV_1372911 [Trichonephila clavipes]
MPLGLGSNSREGMDVCKSIVPLQHGGTLNSCRAASPRVVGGRGRDSRSGLMRATIIDPPFASHGPPNCFFAYVDPLKVVIDPWVSIWTTLKITALDFPFVHALLVEWLRQQTKLPHLEEANPQVYVETPLHPEKLTVCALYGLVESFFKNDEGHNVTVNGDRYIAMITNFFIPELNNHVQELWFQQHGATCYAQLVPQSIY